MREEGSSEGWLPPQAPPGARPWAPPRRRREHPGPPPPREGGAGVGGSPSASRGSGAGERGGGPAFLPGPPPAPGAGRPTDQVALASLLLGALGVLVLLVSAGLGFLLALPCSITGWLLGQRARGRAALEGGTGSSVAHIGVVVGLVGIGLCVLAMAVWSVLSLSGVTPTDVQEQLERRLQREPGTGAAAAMVAWARSTRGG